MTDTSFPDEARPEPLLIPYEQLTPDALHGVLEEYITREGTDYGQIERGLQSQLDKAKGMLASGKVIIVFDQSSERCQIIEARVLQQWKNGEFGDVSLSDAGAGTNAAREQDDSNAYSNDSPINQDEQLQ